MTDRENTPPGSECQRWPESPDIAGLAAMLFIKMGGHFSIGSNGERYSGRPEPCLFRIQDQSLPVLPGAEPHEQFHSDEEWRGAIKLLDYIISRLSAADKNMIFDGFASVAIDERQPFDFRERLQ